MLLLFYFTLFCSGILIEVFHPLVFRPIFASAKICINPNAEQELNSPKVKLHLEVQSIGLELTKPQVSRRVTTLFSVISGRVDVARVPPPPAVPDHGGAAGVHRLHGEERPLQKVQA